MVNEQLPPEVEEKKIVYPVIRTTIKNGQRWKLVRYSLYVDGRLCVPPALPQGGSDQAENTEHKTNYASEKRMCINTTKKKHPTGNNAVSPTPFFRTTREHAAVKQ